jgi:2-polyprenyl-3-methyl-5-hydroxy-6-metoxy-1,4-benzoquinol methylase
MSTEDASYTQRLVKLSGSRLRKVLNVQAPYGWNIRRLVVGETLDIGCGIGRNLDHLRGAGVGVDHNLSSIEVCRRRGLRAYSSDDFDHSEDGKRTYDTLLLAHVLEHMPPPEAQQLVAKFLPYLKSGGRVVLVCPQERGFQSDETHQHFFRHSDLRDLARRLGLRDVQSGSFPLPRWFGKVFTHNETFVVAVKP